MINVELKKEIIEKVRYKIDLHEDIKESEVEKIVAQTVMEVTAGKRMGIGEKEKLSRECFYSIRKLDILQDFMEDPEITEVMINGHKEIFIEKGGRLLKSDKTFESKEKLEDVIQQIVAGCNRVVNEKDPIVDARLSDGSRVNIVLSPPAIVGPIVTVRKFSEKIISMEDLVEFGSLTKEAADFLSDAVKNGYNCFVSGGTSSGKTTLLNALANEIPKESRVITIEDSAELRINKIPNVVSMETRNANSSGCTEISIRDLIKASLRMRPDRIIVGEVRGEEALDMLQAFNTGHDGSLSTGHSNSAYDMLSRLETMVLFAKDLPLPAVRKQISSAIDILIHLEHTRDGKRRVVQIMELDKKVSDNITLRPLFVIDNTGKLVKKNDMNFIRKWNKNE